MKFKKSALAAAVLTVVAGNALAAPVTTALDPRNKIDTTYQTQNGVQLPPHFSQYGQSTGYVTTDNTGGYTNTVRFEVTGTGADDNKFVSATEPTEVEGQTGVKHFTEVRQDTVTKTSNLTDTRLSSEEVATINTRTIDNSSSYRANGLVTRTAETRDGVYLGNTYADRFADPGLLTESNFQAYDLTKVAGAFEDTSSRSRTVVDYNDDQVLDRTIESTSTQGHKDNAVAYDQNGQPVQVGGQTSYVVLEDTSERNFNLTAYNSDIQNGVETSRDPDGKLLVVERSRSSTEQDANYQSDDISGDFVTFKVDGDEVLVSTIHEQTNAQSSKFTNYDDVSAKDLELSRQQSNSYQQTDIFDNFVSYNNQNGTSDLTVYNDGKSNLAWEGQLNLDASWKSREVSEKDGQLNTDSITTGTYELNQQDAYYQPTHNAEGENYNIVKATGNQEIPFPYDYLGGNQPMLLGSMYYNGEDTALQSSLYDSKYHEKTVDGNGNLVHEITNNQYESLNYAANMQENIEVDRDLVRSDLRDETTIGSEVVVSTNPQDQVVSGFTRKFDGSPITLNDVNQWVDDNGDIHHYVVLGLDKNGQEIRTEVQVADAADPTSLSLNATYNQLNTSNSTESVRYNEDEFYKSTDSSLDSYTTTYEDGSVDSDKWTSDQAITVYNENVVDKEWEGSRSNTYENQHVTFADVEGVATAAQINTYAHQDAENTTKYKPGQELVEETNQTESYQWTQEDLLANTAFAAQDNWQRNEKLYAEGASDLGLVVTENGNGTSSYISATQTEESQWASNSQETIYQAGDINSTETGSNSQSTTRTDLVTGNSDTYATNGQFASTEFNTVTGLLASQAVLSTEAAERQESLSQTEAGVTTSTTVVRGYEDEQRSDESATLTVYGSETNVTADGSQTVLAKSETTVVDKFGIEESNQLTQANTNITAAGAATTTTQQRTDDVTGIQLEKTVAGTTTQTSSTTIEAGRIEIDGVALTAEGLNANNTRVQNVANGVADTDAANLGQVRAYYNDVSGRVNQLNSRVDDVEKTSYRGIAIALAAQQQIPNIGAGQFAVFGGVGHYEGESAGALGVASVFADGRTSVSAALGFAGGNEVGGRVGVSYVFGGK